MSLLYSTDFQSWVIKLILETISENRGEVVTAQDWNTVLNKIIEQGDHNSKTLYDLITQLNDDLWDASGISLVHNSLQERTEVDAHSIGSITGLANTLAGIVAGNMTLVAHAAVPLRDAADGHPIAAITDLATTLAALLSTATAASTYQTKITTGTIAPIDADGNDGDVYIMTGVT